MSIYKLGQVNKKIIWGGKKLSKQFGKGEGDEDIAESWVLCVHDEGVNGLDDGRVLSDIAPSPFPVMIKLIDSADALSIQVHPAKTEMWYIIDCEEGASLVYGLKEKFVKEEFLKKVGEGRTEETLNYVPVHKGDVFFIPQGLVHAIGKGITIAEIQQNSNVTYRIYDYNRLKDGKPRELHVMQSLEVIRDFNEEEINAARFENGRKNANQIADCRYFSTSVYDLDGEMKIRAEKDFLSVVILSGSGEIAENGNGKTFAAAPGDSFYLEKGTEAAVSGNVRIIVTE